MMPGHASDTQILEWGKKLGKSPLARDVVVSLRAGADEIWQHAFELLQRESPEYRNAVDDEFTKESKAHCNELLQLIVAIAGEGHSVFYKDEHGDIFHTYSTFGRGNESFNIHYHYLDIVPKGRNENGRGPFWVRRHDEYAKDGAGERRSD